MTLPLIFLKSTGTPSAFTSKANQKREIVGAREKFAEFKLAVVRGALMQLVV